MVNQTIDASKDLDHRTPDQRRADDDRTTVWTFIWVLFAFKVATIGATLYAASGSADAAIFMLVTNWFWMLLPAFAISGPLIYSVRVRRIRRRREALLRAEWMVS